MSDGIPDSKVVGEECTTISVAVDERIEGVATVTLSRPESRNALDAQLRTELSDVLEAIEGDDRVRVVVLTGDDEGKAFVAGADVTELRERNAIEQREVSKRPRIYERIADLPKPVIARINGHALGGGCELAQACDVRIAHERAKLGQPEINLGIVPGGGGTQRLPRLVGQGQAMRLILSGELIDAEEAAEIGLVEEVHGDDFDERVYDLAESMAAKSPVALEFAKTAVRASTQMDLDDGIDYEAELFSQLFATNDKNEGIDAFFEDRDPEWRGR
ncbi:enoyl-CoA hydratase/isomerase family protein [Halalkalicoccus jeotgali]|uniref:Enoyl-CoA hydratase n=1 Tax=Halalkalicoccus jeotgali (strain DSM 18796 / CECT 7217 / JCM 14584 / KCTC 4019 / B3) TaxID=795797 RepID=D8JB43_HALJB|nr:enoyl-CoA hydratase-related protein [Halalkalicoccus jeotgali]ADJ16496.1 enoyl-CoA hydratase [Halalkalicoccus jeotgali B3]ELY41408.1 enoyl-CoA hydratase [Halalkalicoccus jeotgali B3]